MKLSIEMRKNSSSDELHKGPLSAERPVPRAGWAEACKEVAARGEDVLILGEFGNEGDEELVW
jgi:hypothetical protein